MPLVRISVHNGRSPEDLRAIADGVHRALVETVNVPAEDRFQVISEHSDHQFIYDDGYLGIQRTDDLVFIQVFFNAGRTVEQKRALVRAIADNLHAEPGLRREDVFVGLVDVPKENWSFGNGELQYASP